MRRFQRVRINGIVIEGSPLDHHRAGFWLDDEGIGWLGGLSVRREEIARPTAHGAFPSVGYLPQVVIPVSGFVSATSPAELEHMQLQLSGLLAGGATARMMVDGDMGTTWRDVGVAVTAKFKELDATTSSFSVTFWSNDPCAYGESRTTPNEAAVINRGNFESSPIATVNGPQPTGYMVSAGPHDLVVGGSLPAGSTDVVDLATGWVMRNGSLLVDAVEEVDTWAVQPGASVVHTVSRSGSGSASFTIVDRFV